VGLKELIESRDQLVDFLELNWPELKREFLNIEDAGELAKVLQLYQTQGYQPQAAEHLCTHHQVLWTFLHSGRFHGDPRQIANAVAGIPRLSWRRSLDICNRHPSRLVIHQRAWFAYLERRFPHRFLRLQQARTTEEVAAVFQGARTHDRYLLAIKEHPERFLEIRKAAEWRSPIKGILFLSTENVARTLMAQAIARKLFGQALRVESAGLKPGRTDPLVVKVLKQARIDASALSPKSVRSMDPMLFNLVVTFDADVDCPVSLRKALRVCWPIPALQARKGTMAERLERFGKTRDELQERIELLRKRLTSSKRLALIS